MPGPVLIPEHEAQAGAGTHRRGDLRWAAAPGSHAPHTCIPGEASSGHCLRNGVPVPLLCSAPRPWPRWPAFRGAICLSATLSLGQAGAWRPLRGFCLEAPQGVLPSVLLLRMPRWLLSCEGSEASAGVLSLAVAGWVVPRGLASSLHSQPSCETL